MADSLQRENNSKWNILTIGKPTKNSNKGDRTVFDTPLLQTLRLINQFTAAGSQSYRLFSSLPTQNPILIFFFFLLLKLSWFDVICCLYCYLLIDVI